MRYVNHDGALSIDVTLTKPSSQNIGFRYKRDSQGNLVEDIEAAERRLSTYATVTVTETDSGKTILGPTKIDVSVDYDFDAYHSDQINFSLGQIDISHAASDNARASLYRALAKKIVDHINSEW